MITLKLQAGLGNQMFQYAYGRALSLRSGVPLEIDLSWYENQNKIDTVREFSLNHFNIQAKILNKDESSKTDRPGILSKLIRKIKREIFGWSDYVYYRKEARPIKNKYVEGYYWNSESYFKDYTDEIRKDFTLKEPLKSHAQEMKLVIEESIKNKRTPVCIQVRRGDYVTNTYAKSFHGICDIEYFEKALKEMTSLLHEKELVFFIVSDDMPWARENIIPKDNSGQQLPVEYISRPGIADYEELYLMSLCHHFIISNSTFSWWGAWLSANKGKVVIGPKKWVNDPKINTKDVMPPEWIRI